jgi:hypothetical protein
MKKSLVILSLVSASVMLTACDQPQKDGMEAQPKQAEPAPAEPAPATGTNEMPAMPHDSHSNESDAPPAATPEK